ncbi:MAG: hypothetical protein JWQ88_2159, partial [Rhodoferax sp.]|nr:hypothetical protein [Rhodoferax sp.]
MNEAWAWWTVACMVSALAGIGVGAALGLRRGLQRGGQAAMAQTHDPALVQQVLEPLLEAQTAALTQAWAARSQAASTVDDRKMAAQQAPMPMPAPEV